MRGVVTVVSAATLLAGCSSTAAMVPPVAPSAAPPSASASPESAPESAPAVEPSLDPSGSAEANHAYFDLVNRRLLAERSMPGGRAIIDNLVAAGFDRAAMQVTADRTAIGGTVDSQQFSVRIGERCLIGQASDAGYQSLEGPTVSGGACLIGQTRPIDW